MDLYFHRMHGSVPPQPVCFLIVHSDGENCNRFSVLHHNQNTVFFLNLIYTLTWSAHMFGLLIHKYQ